MDSIRYSAVQRFKQNSAVLNSHARGTKKSGSQDASSKWARARVQQCEQLRAQFRPGQRPGGPPTGTPPPLFPTGIVFWDESHFRIRLGHASKTEVLVCRHPQTGRPCSPENGGVWPDEMPSTNVKYPGECRFAFGVAAVEPLPADGDDVSDTPLEPEGRKAAPFEYTGAKVVGVQVFEKDVAAELARAKTLVGGKWRRAGGNGYEGLYGPAARVEVVKALRAKGLICVTEIMDHAGPGVVFRPVPGTTRVPRRASPRRHFTKSSENGREDSRGSVDGLGARRGGETLTSAPSGRRGVEADHGGHQAP